MVDLIQGRWPLFIVPSPGLAVLSGLGSDIRIHVVSWCSSSSEFVLAQFLHQLIAFHFVWSQRQFCFTGTISRKAKEQTFFI